MIYLETGRLLLRDWEKDDLVEFRRLNADKEVLRFFPKTLSDAQSDVLYQNIISEIKACGFGLYAVETKENKDFIGFLGFHKATFQADFTPCIEIGWRLKKEVWGKGLATEGAKACLHYGFHTLGFDDIFSFTADINTASKNVMTKIGLNFKNYFNHPNVDQSSPLNKHVLYHLNKQQYLSLTKQ